MYILRRDPAKAVEEQGFDEVCYWRKFNALHGLFLRTFNMTDDDLDSPAISAENVKTWLDILDKAEAAYLNNDTDTLKKILPCKEGFFFGSQEYDDWYHDDIVDAKKQLTKLLKLIKTDHDHTYHYYASW